MLRALPGTIAEADQFLAAFRRRRSVRGCIAFHLQASFEMEAINTDIDVTLGGRGGRAIACTRLVDGDRTDTGRHLALRQGGRDRRRAGCRPGSSNRHAGRASMRPRPRPSWRAGHAPACARLLSADPRSSWLNQLDDAIVGQRISLLRWRSGASSTPRYAAFPIPAITNFGR